MSVAQLREVLDGLDEASSCSGSYNVGERIALTLPDGDVGAVDDARFVDWLLAHAEPAPFGDGGVTKIDKKVRSAQRLTARDKVTVHGFDPEALLDDIGAVLSPTRQLSAKLTDVIVYRKGGKFARHKDTPRSPDLVGTLVVGLPVAHDGGAFVVDDGRGTQTFDWSGKPKPNTVQWVALFSDVDHEIKPVKSGARVTLVYALHRTTMRCAGVAAQARQTAATQAASALAQQKDWPVLIACGRHVIAEPGEKQPLGIDTLRGLDRDVAEALAAAGFRVDVRACIAAIPNYNDPAPFPDTANLWSLTRLKSVPPRDILDGMNDEGTASDIEEYLLDQVQIDRCAIRRTAASTLIHEQGSWSETGYFGNEGYDALLYTLAAIEVSKAKPKAKAKPKKKPR